MYVRTALIAGTVSSFKKCFPTPVGRAQFAFSAGHNPALLSLFGPLFGNSIGSLTAWRYGGFAALGAGLVSLFIVIQHTRPHEETGRRALLQPAANGPFTPLTPTPRNDTGAHLVIAGPITAAHGLLSPPIA